MIDNDNVKLLDKYVETCTNTMNQLHMGDFFFLIKRDMNEEYYSCKQT